MYVAAPGTPSSRDLQFGFSNPLAHRRGPSPGILVVEDDPHVRALVVRILERTGFSCLDAPGPREALETLKGLDRGEILPPALVLADVLLPGMPTPEFLECLRTRLPAAPVLLMSGCAPAELRRQGVDPSELALRKPFGPEELLSAIEGAGIPIPPGRGGPQGA